MAGLINPTQLDFSYEAVKEFSELYFKEAVNAPEISVVNSIQTGIRTKKQIGIAGRLGIAGKTLSSCTFTADNQIIPFTEKFWDPAIIDIPFSQCFTDLVGENSIFWHWVVKNNKDKLDLTGTDFDTFFTDLYEELIRKTILRLSWFGDTDAANFSDSPAGEITDGTSETYFTPFDGLWKQLLAITVSDTDRHVNIAKNEQATYANQALADDTAIDIFENLRDNAHDVLYNDDNAAIYCTKSLALNYAKTLRSKSVSESFTRIEGGYSALAFDGVPVIAVPLWDELINAYQNNGTKRINPHRAVYYNPENLPIGVEQTEGLEDFNRWFDPNSGEFRVRGLITLDSKVVIDDYVQIAI